MAYPSSFDELTDLVPSDGAAPTTALDAPGFELDNWARLISAAVEAVQVELDTDPSGAAATVKARIEAAETRLLPAAVSPVPPPDLFVVGAGPNILNFSAIYMTAPVASVAAGYFEVQFGEAADFSDGLSMALTGSGLSLSLPGFTGYGFALFDSAAATPYYARCRAVDCYGTASTWVVFGDPTAVTPAKVSTAQVAVNGAAYGGTATNLTQALAEIAAAAGMTP